MFLCKRPCTAPRVLDIVDCPAYNHDHDIASYPKFYDPLYFPQFYPQVFATWYSVKDWLQSSLNSHVDFCHVCAASCSMRGVKFTVQWQEFSFVICSYFCGKIRQCLLSLEELQSCKYSHCRLLLRLCHPISFPHNKIDSVPFPSQSSSLLSTMDKELPAWLFYTDELYTLHLSHLSASDLAAAAKCCSQISDESKRTHAKSSYISKIVSHFVSQRACLVSLSTVKGVSYSAFVDFMEKSYGATVAASLREPPFMLASVINRNCHFSQLVWFNESIDDLVHRLRSIKLQSLLDAVKRIPAYRRPTYDRASH